MRTVALLLAFAVPLAAQDAATRVAGRVPPAVASAVAQAATDLGARGLPVGPIVDKAIEGAAKGVPADRVIAAVRALAASLGAAADAVRAAGVPVNDSAAVSAGAFAMSAGLGVQQVRDVARAAKAPYTPEAALQVAGTLSAIGVAPDQAAQLVLRSMGAQGQLSALPGEVEAGMAGGASPGAAAAGVARGLSHAAPGQPHGPPDGRGRKP